MGLFDNLFINSEEDKQRLTLGNYTVQENSTTPSTNSETYVSTYNVPSMPTQQQPPYNVIQQMTQLEAQQQQFNALAMQVRNAAQVSFSGFFQNGFPVFYDLNGVASQYGNMFEYYGNNNGMNAFYDPQNILGQNQYYNQQQGITGSTGMVYADGRNQMMNNGFVGVNTTVPMNNISRAVREELLSNNTYGMAPDDNSINQYRMEETRREQAIANARENKPTTQPQMQQSYKPQPTPQMPQYDGYYEPGKYSHQSTQEEAEQYTREVEEKRELTNDVLDVKNDCKALSKDDKDIYAMLGMISDAVVAVQSNLNSFKTQMFLNQNGKLSEEQIARRQESREQDMLITKDFEDRLARLEKAGGDELEKRVNGLKKTIDTLTQENNNLKKDLDALKRQKPSKKEKVVTPNIDEIVEATVKKVSEQYEEKIESAIQETMERVSAKYEKQIQELMEKHQEEVDDLKKEIQMRNEKNQQLFGELSKEMGKSQRLEKELENLKKEETVEDADEDEEIEVKSTFIPDESEYRDLTLDEVKTKLKEINNKILDLVGGKDSSDAVGIKFMIQQLAQKLSCNGVQEKIEELRKEENGKDYECDKEYESKRRMLCAVNYVLENYDKDNENIIEALQTLLSERTIELDFLSGRYDDELNAMRKGELLKCGECIFCNNDKCALKYSDNYGRKCDNISWCTEYVLPKKEPETTEDGMIDIFGIGKKEEKPVEEQVSNSDANLQILQNAIDKKYDEVDKLEKKLENMKDAKKKNKLQAQIDRIYKEIQERERDLQILSSSDYVDEEPEKAPQEDPALEKAKMKSQDIINNVLPSGFVAGEIKDQY